jgi:hypothetical protein
VKHPSHEKQQDALRTANPKDRQNAAQDAPIVLNMDSRPKSKAEAAEEQSENNRKKWIDIGTVVGALLAALFTGLLVIVGWCGVRAAVRTLKALERQIAVMEAPYAQYLTDNWIHADDGSERDDSVPISNATLFITIRNSSDYPLVIEDGSITFTLEGAPAQACFLNGRLLEKQGQQVFNVPFPLTQSQVTAYRERVLVFDVDGTYVFTDILQRRQVHRIRGKYFCGRRDRRFERADIWIGRP